MQSCSVFSKYKATYFEIGVLSGCRGEIAKFAIIFLFLSSPSPPHPAEFEAFKIASVVLMLTLILVLNIPKIKTEKNLTAVTGKCAPISDHTD